jgi:class 3 adenylate cyclase
MDDKESLKQLVQSLNVGIAVVDPETWEIAFENARFFQWFPPGEDADEPFGARVDCFDAERAMRRLGGTRPYTFDAETRVGARTIPVAIELRWYEAGGGKYLLAECRNVSKQKEIEYMLESYSKLSEKNARELQKEKERVEKLLLNIMPRSVYEEMKDYGTATPQKFECASVLMLDFVGFTEMAISRDAGSIISELNDIFSAFDRIVELFGCERIKTIGDAYMAVSGIPEAAPEHAANIAKVALRMRRYLEKRNAAHPQEWLCRIGISSGPVIGSIVGIQKYVYDIFGPAVNLAARMETTSEPMRISVADDCYELLKDEFVLTESGEFEIKGFGMKRIYFLEAELPHTR